MNTTEIYGVDPAVAIDVKGEIELEKICESFEAIWPIPGFSFGVRRSNSDH